MERGVGTFGVCGVAKTSRKKTRTSKDLWRPRELKRATKKRKPLRKVMEINAYRNRD